MTDFSIPYGELTLGGLPDADGRFRKALHDIGESFMDADNHNGKPLKAAFTLSFEFECTPDGRVSVLLSGKTKIPCRPNRLQPLLFQNGQFLVEQDDAGAQLVLAPTLLHPSLRPKE